MLKWRSISWSSGLFSATWRARNAAAEANRTKPVTGWMMGHDGTWRHGISVFRPKKMCLWREHSFAASLMHGPLGPLPLFCQCTKQVTANPSRIVSRNISVSAHICTCQSCQDQLSAWNGEAFCSAKRAPAIGPASSHLWWGGTTALPWLHAAADAGFDHPNMGVHNKRHRNTLYTYIHMYIYNIILYYIMLYYTILNFILLYYIIYYILYIIYFRLYIIYHISYIITYLSYIIYYIMLYYIIWYSTIS